MHSWSAGTRRGNSSCLKTPVCFFFIGRVTCSLKEQDFSQGKLGVGLTQWVGVPHSTV